MKIEVGSTAMIMTALSLRTGKEKKRDYLGVSSLGEECDKKLWYKYHKPELANKVEPRIQAIFDMGHIIEKYIVDLLIETGREVYDKQADGSQFEAIYKEKIKGHIDGVIKGIPESDKPHLLEVKSMNDKNFSKLGKDKVEYAFPHYWVQCQVYMYLFKLDKCLFVAMNKNDCEIYTERFSLDSIQAEAWLKRGLEITDKKEEEVARKFATKSFYKCKMCDFNTACWA